MSDEVAEDILRYIRLNITKYKGVIINWFGGEPLLALPLIEKISCKCISICKSLRKPYMAEITTNGYLLTKGTMEKLIKLHVYNFIITVDGFRESHDSLRVLANSRGTFDTIIQNLEYIKDGIKSNRISVVIRTNVIGPMVSRLEELYNWLDDRFGEDARFSVMLARVL